MCVLSEPAPAKVNLTLRVGPRRRDGYHEIESLVMLVGLCDDVRVRPRDDERIILRCDAPAVPTDERNLAIQAAHRLRERAARALCGVAIELKKRIPAGAGLGGGSSDAAATLRMLNRLWGLNLSTESLARIGAEIGADVPLFLHGPTSVIRGRGEQVTPADPPAPGRIVILLPPIHCATATVYGALRTQDRETPRVDAPRALAALDQPARAMEVLFNDLEAPARRAYPALGSLMTRATELARGPLRMSGSGSALFRLFAAAHEAQAFATRVRETLGVRAESLRYPWSSA